MNEEERRRQIAKDNLKLLEAQNVDVRKALQTELENMQIQKIQKVTINDPKLQLEKVRSRLVPTCVTLTDTDVVVGTKDGSVISYTRELKHIQTVAGQRTVQKHPKLPTSYKQYFGDQYEFHHGPVLSLEFNKQLISASHNCCLLPGKSFHAQKTSCAALTQQLLFVGANKQIYVANIQDKMVMHNLIGHVDTIKQIVPLPLSNQFLSASTDQSLRLFDYEAQSQLIYLADSPLECCFAFNNEWFVAGGEALYLFNRQKRNYSQKITFQGGFMDTLVNCCSGVYQYQVLAVGMKNKILIFELDNDSLKEVRQIDVEGFVNDICCKLIGNQIVCSFVVGGERKCDRLEVLKTDKKVGIFVLGEVEIKKGRWK